MVPSPKPTEQNKKSETYMETDRNLETERTKAGEASGREAEIKDDRD